MLTDVQAQEAYLKARRALTKITRSRNMTTAQRAAAQQARQKLNHEFVDSNIESFEERTAQFEAFVEDMKSVIGSVDGPSPVKGLDDLKEVVSSATTVIETIKNA